MSIMHNESVTHASLGLANQSPLFGSIVHTPPREWTTPEKVVRIKGGSTVMDVLAGHEIAPEPQLRFKVIRPWITTLRRAPESKGKPVKPRRDTFQRFLRLANSSALEIEQFAREFGPLGVFCAVEELDRSFLRVTESIAVWKYFASCFRALLQLAPKFAQDAHVARDAAEWDALAVCPWQIGYFGPAPNHDPEPDELLGFSKKDRESIKALAEGVLRKDRESIKGPRNKTQEPDPLSLTILPAEVAWAHQVYYIGRSRRGFSRGLGASDRDRHSWLRLVNTLIELGNVRPWLLWEDLKSRPSIVFSGPSLMSYLVLQLCHQVSAHNNFFECVGCRSQYSSERSPKYGQQNFCPNCRQSGVPQKLRQRRYRERLRKNKKHSRVMHQ